MPTLAARMAQRLSTAKSTQMQFCRFKKILTHQHKTGKSQYASYRLASSDGDLAPYRTPLSREQI